MTSYTMQMRWDEPETGAHSWVMWLSPQDLSELEKAVEWLMEEAGDHWGDDIPQFEIVETRPQGVRGGLNLAESMKELRIQSRYEEGVYDKTYKPFENLK